VFDEPRVHVALNFASRSCPMLSDRAFTAATPDAQLEDQWRRFLSDRTRNRFEAASGTLLLSRIFDWHRRDFERGSRSFLGFAGFTGGPDIAARYAEQLADSEADRTRLRARSRRDFSITTGP